MTEPRVLCLCPSHIPQFAKRAAKFYLSQTYPLVAWNYWDTAGSKLSIGTIRNKLISETPFLSEFTHIAHFDHDDYSAPERIADQLRFMLQENAEVTGYSDMAFYDATLDRCLWYDSRMRRNYALGTSLLYKREVWEQLPFPDQTPEDTTWQFRHGKTIAQSSVRDGKIMMFQTLHGGNASARASAAAFDPSPKEIEDQVRAILLRFPLSSAPTIGPTP